MPHKLSSTTVIAPRGVATGGTVRTALDDVKQFDPGVVLLPYLPAS